MSDLDDVLSSHKFPENIVGESLENKKKYFDDAFEKFIDKFVLQKVNISDFNDRDDCVRNYATCFIFLAILVMQMKDIASQGDGNRNLINQKLLQSVFKSMGAYSKYAIERFLGIAHTVLANSTPI